jgi:hypothetical protein
MITWLKNIFFGKTIEEKKVEVATPAVVETQVTEVVTETPKRAKDKRGKFVGDNPNTPTNEAWVNGKAPAKKPRKPYTKKKKAE